MNKTEQKLMNCYKQRKEFKSNIDSLAVDTFKYKAIDYFIKNTFVFTKNLKADSKEIGYFCVPTYYKGSYNTLQRRLNLFLQEYRLKISLKNGLYFCNDKEIRLNMIYFIIKDNKGNYFID